MRIDEREDMVVHAQPRLLGEFQPAVADIDAAHVQAQEQRRGVGDVEIVVRLFGAHAPVVQVEDRVVLLQRQMEEGAVPPEVKGEIVGLLPDRFVVRDRSEEHTSELQSLMRISYAVFCLKKNNKRDYHQKSPA